MSYMQHNVIGEAIQNNFRIISGKTQAIVGGVIKANGYGHGLIEVANALEQVGCTLFFVGSVEEGVSLRLHKISGEIFPLLGVRTYEEVTICERYGLTPVIHMREQLDFVAHYKQSIAIKCDTGMSRLGFKLTEIEDMLVYCQQKGITIGYIFSHLTTSVDIENVKRQQEEFEKMCTLIRSNYPFVKTSLGNSGSLECELTLGYDIVRCGIALYGYGVDISNLKPAMEIYTSILQIRDIPKGRTVSYNNTFIAPKDMRVASIACGYADGYHRGSRDGYVIVEGKCAPILGTICMQSCIIDISHIEEATLRSKVYVLQPSSGLCATTIAKSWGTISYEVLCSLGKS